MKRIITLVLLLIATSAFANGTMPTDSLGNKWPVFSPNGATAVLLTVNSTTFDMTSYFAYSIIGTAATCKMRLMPTSAKGAYVSISIPAASYMTFAVNQATPFLNLSGCTGGYRILQ